MSVRSSGVLCVGRCAIDNFVFVVAFFFEFFLFVVAPSGSFCLSLHHWFLRVCRCAVGFCFVCRCTVGLLLAFRYVVASSFVGRWVVGFFSFASTPLVSLCSCRFN